MEAITTVITVETTVNAPIEKVWQCWTTPDHVMHWNNASDDWHTPHAINDLRAGGRFVYQMAARDGSLSFDFGGIYDEVFENELIEYRLDDGRKVSVHFSKEGNGTKVVERFEPESENAHELQQSGWQAILDNFKKYVEAG